MVVCCAELWCGLHGEDPEVDSDKIFCSCPGNPLVRVAMSFSGGLICVNAREKKSAAAIYLIFDRPFCYLCACLCKEWKWEKRRWLKAHHFVWRKGGRGKELVFLCPFSQGSYVRVMDLLVKRTCLWGEVKLQTAYVHRKHQCWVHILFLCLELKLVSIICIGTHVVLCSLFSFVR